MEACRIALDAHERYSLVAAETADGRFSISYRPGATAWCAHSTGQDRGDDSRRRGGQGSSPPEPRNPRTCASSSAGVLAARCPPGSERRKYAP